MRIVLHIILMGFLILNSSGSILFAEEEFIYDSRNRRDPFIPLVTKEGKVLFGIESGGSISGMVLEGIVWEPRGDSFAILNEIVAREGDVIEGFKVERIERSGIILLRDNQKFIINLTVEEE